jgi:hypothetical protein
MSSELITPGTAVATAASGFAFKLLYDVCGPSAKYLGKELESYTEKGVKNLNRVLETAWEIIRKQNKVEGQVPPRVLKDVLAEGYFCEDELTAMYLGGVLASSKSSVSRDDRAVAYCALIRSLSTYQIRTHCILYTMLLRTPREKTQFESPFPHVREHLRKHGITVAFRESDYISAMEFSAAENPEKITQHSFVGLEKHGLIEGGLHVAIPGKSKGETNVIRWIYPTILGVELFLWGQGLGEMDWEDFSPELLAQLNLPFRVAPEQVNYMHVNYATT